jgi:hypothetical protein
MTTCQHGQSQRQCPLCERDETIADLRNDVLRVTMERDALRAEVERLRPYEQAVRDHHNGYDPEARAAMAPFLKEPASPKQAIDELIDEAEAPLAKELAAAQQLAIDDEKTIQCLRARLAAAEKVVSAAQDCDETDLGSGWHSDKHDIAHEELEEALDAYDAAKETNTP